MIVSLAPMQGYTDAAYRVALHECIGGVDKYYAPYLKYENDGRIKNKYLFDILPEQNKGLLLVPQILSNKTSEFRDAIKRIKQMGYLELNWNLGCPYPMVTNKKLGAGLLPYPEIIQSILNDLFDKTEIELSVKVRAGLATNDEIFRVIDILNQFPIKEIIFHPRIAKQLYKGLADRALLKPLIEQSRNPVAYNGDILDFTGVHQLKAEFPAIEHIMIGRGLLSNPLLALEIKENQRLTNDRKKILFQQFHNKIFEANEIRLAGAGHLLNKMMVYWEYFSVLFENQHRVFKEIKKCRTVTDFCARSKAIISEGNFSGI
jgi:tRNA-dihydrouridine synthase B